MCVVGLTVPVRTGDALCHTLVLYIGRTGNVFGKCPSVPFVFIVIRTNGAAQSYTSANEHCRLLL